MKNKGIEHKIWNNNVSDFPTQTLLDLEPVYDQHKTECYNVMVYMCKKKYSIEAITEASRSLDRAILDRYHIQDELIRRRFAEYGRKY